jgi:hypothetical protein
MPLCANGHGVPVTAAYCSICGAAMQPSTPAAPLPPPTWGPPGWTPGQPAARTGNGAGTAALTLGILSLVVCWPLGILAVVFGAVAIGRCNRGEATNRGSAQWGLGLGIAGTVIGLILATWFLSNFDTSQPLF